MTFVCVGLLCLSLIGMVVFCIMCLKMQDMEFQNDSEEMQKDIERTVGDIMKEGDK